MRLLATGNEEFDSKIGGGMPHPGFMVIEGDHGSGKTALSLLFLRGALRSGLRAVVFTSESRSADYIRKAEASGFPLEDFYLRRQLRVYSIQYPGMLDGRTADAITLRLLYALARLGSEYDFFVLDSLSYIAPIASPPLMNQLIVAIRQLTVRNRSFIVTVHPKLLPPDISVKLAGSADGYLKTSAAVIGGRRLKVLSIVKLRGAPPGIETTITFDVDPAFGIKIVPIMISQA